MTLKMTNWAWRQPVADPCAKLMLVALADWADDYGALSRALTKGDLARIACVSLAVVSAGCGELAACGLLCERRDPSRPPFLNLAWTPTAEPRA